MRIDHRRAFRAQDSLLSYPVHRGKPFSPGLLARCARLFTGLGAWSRERQTADELAAMSDRMLEDIGLTRGDLPFPPRRRPLDDLR